MPANVTGGAVKFAHGGSVGATNYLAGGGNPWQPQGTDTVRAMLSPGEFVVKQKSAAYAPQFMKAYNDNPAGALAAYGGGGNITVTVVNKTGMTLSDLIDIQVHRSQRQMSSGIGTGKQKGAY
jgi:GTP cyclohydrolase III